MRAQRRDRNHGEVADTFRKMGCVVVPMSREAGFDLLVGLTWGRGWICVEVKDGEASPSRRELTTNEEKFQEICRIKGLPHRVILSVDEAIGLVNGV
jgi:hypothetical protein